VDAVPAQRYAPPLERLSVILEEWRLASTGKSRTDVVRNSAVFVCNPNSPTGRHISLRAFRQIVSQVDRVGCWMIVDEAFIDWCPSHSLMKDISRYRRLIILRSFTKFFAIPGIRLGYLVGGPGVIESLRRHLPPWSVNHVAQSAGVAALEDSRFRKRSLQFMQQERSRFMAMLRTVPGLRVIPSQANFVMLEIVDGPSAKDMVEGLQTQGLLVRDCQTFSGMTRPALRVAVRLSRENRRLVKELTKLLQERNPLKLGCA